MIIGTPSPSSIMANSARYKRLLLEMMRDLALWADSRPTVFARWPAGQVEDPFAKYSLL